RSRGEGRSDSRRFAREERLVRRSSTSEGGCDEAIHTSLLRHGLLRCARNDGVGLSSRLPHGRCLRLRWSLPSEAASFPSSHSIRSRSMDNRNDIWRGVDAIKARFIDLSDRVWATPEVCYTEARSSAEHLAELRHHGFRITENVADIPTALMGEWGEGGPVIAFLGEYDALPGLSQEADVAEPRPVEAGGHGHGCGHNLLGSVPLLRATAGQQSAGDAQ